MGDSLSHLDDLLIVIHLLESTVQPLNNSNQVNAHCCKFLKRAVALILKHSQQHIVNIW